MDLKSKQFDNIELGIAAVSGVILGALGFKLLSGPTKPAGQAVLTGGVRPTSWPAGLGSQWLAGHATPCNEWVRKSRASQMAYLESILSQFNQGWTVSPNDAHLARTAVALFPGLAHCGGGASSDTRACNSSIGQLMAMILDDCARQELGGTVR